MKAGLPSRAAKLALSRSVSVKKMSKIARLDSQSSSHTADFGYFHLLALLWV